MSPLQQLAGYYRRGAHAWYRLELWNSFCGRTETHRRVYFLPTEWPRPLSFCGETTDREHVAIYFEFLDQLRPLRLRSRAGRRELLSAHRDLRPRGFSRAPADSNRRTIDADRNGEPDFEFSFNRLSLICFLCGLVRSVNY